MGSKNTEEHDIYKTLDRLHATCDALEEGRGGDPWRYRGQLRHLDSLCWSQVFRGELRTPGLVLDRCAQLGDFAARHQPAPTSPLEEAARDAHALIDHLRIAEDALQPLLLASSLRSLTDSHLRRALLDTLLECKDEYLPRRELHARLRLPSGTAKPSPPRVSQLLHEFSEPARATARCGASR